MKFSWAADSRIGGRNYNEDRVLVLNSKAAWLLVVADGMGGHLHGELASQMVIDTLSHHFELTACPRLAQPQSFLANALEEVQHALIRLALSRRFPEVPSTTLAAALVQDGQLYCAWVGDSRLYLCAGGQLQWRTRDHSTVQKLIDQGAISPQAALTHPDRNRVTSCLGGMERPEIGLAGPLPFGEGTTLLVCSDGVWSQMQDAEIARALGARLPVAVVPALLKVAQRRAGASCDNLSAAALTLLPSSASGAGVFDSDDAPDIPDAMNATLDSELLASRREP